MKIMGVICDCNYFFWLDIFNKATNIIIDALNFKKNNKKFPQIWHIASGKPTTVKNFILSKFHKKKLTKISFRNSSKMVRNFVSHKKFIWKI